MENQTNLTNAGKLCTYPMCLLDYVIFSVGPITAIVAAAFGLKSWLRYEIGVSFSIALILFVQPQWIFSYLLNTPVTSYHKYLCSIYACYLVYSTLFNVFLFKSQDNSVFSCHFWGKIIANVLIIMDNYFAYSESGGHWNYRLLCLSISFYITWLIISGYFFVLGANNRNNGLELSYDRVNMIAKLESFLILSVGLVMYAFPEKSMLGLTNPNESHRSICRTAGALVFSCSYESFCVSEFAWKADKKLFMLSRFIGSLLDLVTVLLGFFVYGVLPLSAFIIFSIWNMSYNSLVMYGYFITPKDIQPRKISSKDSD